MSAVHRPSKVIAFSAFAFAAISSQSVVAQKISEGTIQGTISFPSDAIPPDMRVCAIQIVGGKEFCTTRKTKRGVLYAYSLKVPVGQYYVYASTNDRSAGDLRGSKAFFTEFVKCGLHVRCRSHEKVLVQVTLDSVINGVNPHDWYE